MNSDFPAVIKIGFDPPAAIFVDDTARTFYLLWRCCHLVGEGFEVAVLVTSRLIDQYRPVTASQLVKLVSRGDTGKPYTEFGSFGSYDEWCEQALPYFTGEKTIGYELTATV